MIDPLWTGSREPVSRDDLATVDHLGDLPNGWATVVLVRSRDKELSKLARIDDEGFIVTVDGEYVLAEDNHVEAVDGGPV